MHVERYKSNEAYQCWWEWVAASVVVVKVRHIPISLVPTKGKFQLSITINGRARREDNLHLMFPAIFLHMINADNTSTMRRARRRIMLNTKKETTALARGVR
jgi:hypothetical protein